VLKTDQSKLFREGYSMYCENNIEITNVFFGQSAGLLNILADGTGL
jgi:hypothetical protein